MYSARPAASLVVSDLADSLGLARPQRRRGSDAAGEALARAVADEVARQVDGLLAGRGETAAVGQPDPTGLETVVGDAACTCVSGISVASVVVGDQTVELLALPAIFALFREEGRSPHDAATADELMQQIKVYNAVAAEDENALREAVADEYARFWAQTAPAIGQ
jgi:hypothetical protein